MVWRDKGMPKGRLYNWEGIATIGKVCVYHVSCDAYCGVYTVLSVG